MKLHLIERMSLIRLKSTLSNWQNEKFMYMMKKAYYETDGSPSFLFAWTHIPATFVHLRCNIQPTSLSADDEPHQDNQLRPE